MNKITFCSYPDYVDSKKSYAIKNYNNHTIKDLLNNIDQNAVFYLIEQDSPNEWLKNVIKKVNIVFDCAKIPLDQVKKICQKK